MINTHPKFNCSVSFILHLSYDCVIVPYDLGRDEISSIETSKMG